jgi:hypothetical protein
MATFDNIAIHSNYPVVFSKRNDDACLIATRVPLDDIRLENWGWILSLSYKDGSSNSDDIETLQDNLGKKYPKVYLLPDIQNYVEKWGCYEWEEWYPRNSNTNVRAKVTMPLSKPTLQENLLQEKIDELRVAYEQKIKYLQSEMNTKTDIIIEGLRTSYKEVNSILSQNTSTVVKILPDALQRHADIQKHLEDSYENNPVALSMMCQAASLRARVTV